MKEESMNTIQIYHENGEWKALIGPNPDEGIVGRADSPIRALQDLVFKLQISDWDFVRKPLKNNNPMEEKQ